MDLNSLIILCFILGYLSIAFERKTGIHKSASALLAGVLSWTIFILIPGNRDLAPVILLEKLGKISGILFFLLGAMTIVELIDAHDGFEVITERIKVQRKRKLLWILSIIAFFLSAFIDNLTTAIVMVSLIRKLVPGQKERWIFAGTIIIAANAGGAWSPIGDVTTTMLWMGGQVTALMIVLRLFVPSLFSLIIPLIFSTFLIKDGDSYSQMQPKQDRFTTKFERRFVFYSGIMALLSIPLFSGITHLPPYMGMLFALGLIWCLTEMMHRGKEENTRGSLSVSHALKNTDSPTILFFLGILLCISALESSGILIRGAGFLSTYIKDERLIASLFGLISSIVDNVPLVAAVQGMYPLTVIPTDHFFWEFIAYATGTGGSILIIGSAAGIAVMGMENIHFFWYMKKFSIPALLGTVSGAAIYILQSMIFK
jgi:Na+/H+ antiporter NhaD/arsenite permease-like protein